MFVIYSKPILILFTLHYQAEPLLEILASLMRPTVLDGMEALKFQPRTPSMTRSKLFQVVDRQLLVGLQMLLLLPLRMAKLWYMKPHLVSGKINLLLVVGML